MSTPKHIQFIYFAYLILICAGGVAAELVVATTPFADVHCRTALLSLWPFNASAGNGNVIVSGELLSFEVADAGNAAQVSGRIVVMGTSWQEINLQNYCLDYQRKGASAILISTSYLDPGRAVYTLGYLLGNDAAFANEIKLPIFQITNGECGDVADAVFAGQNITANITTIGNENTFKLWKEDGLSILPQVLICVPSVAGIIFAAVRLSTIVKAWGVRPRLPHVVLFLHILTFIFRFIFGIDLMGMRGWIHPYFVLFFHTPNFALAIICHVIILFYWNKALKSFGSSSIEKAEKWVFISIGVFGGIELIGCIMYGFEQAPVFTYVRIGYYALATIAVLVYVIYTTIYLFKFLEATRLNKKQQRARAKVVLMTKLLLVCTVLLFLSEVLVLLLVAPFFRRAVSESIIWTAICLLLTASGYAEIFVIKKPSRQHGGSRSSRTTGSATERGRHNSGRTTSSPSLSKTSLDIITPRVPDEDASKKNDVVSVEVLDE